MFDNTGIATYIWVLDSNKPAKRKGKVQLMNAVEMFGKVRNSHGSKRNELRPKNIERICHLYDSFRNERGSDEWNSNSRWVANSRSSADLILKLPVSAISLSWKNSTCRGTLVAREPFS